VFNSIETVTAMVQAVSVIELLCCFRVQITHLFYHYYLFTAHVTTLIFFLLHGDDGGGHCLVRMEWRPAGWSVCLPLLIFPCTIKSRSPLLAPAHLGGPEKRAVKRLWWCGGSYREEETSRLLYRIITIYSLQSYQCVVNDGHDKHAMTYSA